MQAAWEAAEHTSIMSLMSQRADIIAKALLAERERCAQIAITAADEARKLVRTFGETTCAGFCAKTAEDIAAAIRQQASP